MNCAAGSFAYMFGATLCVSCDGGCFDPCADDSLAVDDAMIPSDTYLAAINVSSEGGISTGNTVTFKAGYDIVLKPGFSATNGATFTALIEGCDLTAPPPAAAPQAATDIPAADIRPPTNQLLVTPNPVFTQAKIQLHVAKPGPLQLRLFSGSGQEVMALELPGTMAGWREVTFYRGQMPAGLYHLVLLTGNETLSTTVVVR